MEIGLRQWYIDCDEEAFIDLINRYDRTYYEYGSSESLARNGCTKEDAIHYIKRSMDLALDGEGCAWAITADEKVVGYAMRLKRRDITDASCDLQVFLLPEYCEKGIGTEVVGRIVDEALNERDYEIVYLAIDVENGAARRMVEKLGFEFCRECEGYSGSKECMVAIYGKFKEIKPTIGSGVELKAWRPRDIRSLLYLFSTVDRRYDDIPNPEEDIRREQSELTVYESEEWKEQRILYAARDYIDRWNYEERNGVGIYRAIINDGIIVGLVSIRMHDRHRRGEADMGYLLTQEACGKGVATKAVSLMLREAFGREDIRRVSAYVYAPNEASKRVLEKNGFSYEGMLRKAVVCEGEPTDYLIYGLLRSEYEH